MPVTLNFWRPVLVRYYNHCKPPCYICRQLSHCMSCKFLPTICGHGYHEHCMKNITICHVCRQPIIILK
ncbi:RING-H2 zinc finger [Sea otter poxvirus]|uniref:RING-H2 zinc finger n=1 Tax=Sea otter poxvirus TaxID=1416741 RepID=A0A2U9QHJ8_9POXV|nr:RING-H2 zinc finger [Sea otter poxvirus]AWU47066.1 RING-H2 zinc finger [Sea otter poxvirus]